MYFHDLTPYEYTTKSARWNAPNIGWLSREHAFPTGDTPAEFRNFLNRLALKPSNGCMGWHDCEFCVPSRRRFAFWRRSSKRSLTVARGNGEVHVPAVQGDSIFVAPQMVAHYVEVHGYLPPAAFVEAVLAYQEPVIVSDTMRAAWKDCFPALDGKWNQWRIYEDGMLLAVVAEDNISQALDKLERAFCAAAGVGVSRSYLDPGGDGVVVEPIRHEIFTAEMARAHLRLKLFEWD